ncbi:MAG: hypothetical protein IJI45_11475 [Anaerolineaceae bacterium]|nr:hypothetical protein [Anaerolineaceae bacterium]
MEIKETLSAINKKAGTLDKIKGELGREELLAQFAEECAELGKAALKLRRGLDGRNVTPVSVLDAELDLQEEMADVFLLMVLCDMEDGEVAETIYKKVPRWAGRLGLEE